LASAPGAAAALPPGSGTEGLLVAAGGRLGSAMRGSGAGSTSATEVPDRTNTGLRCGESAELSIRGGATPSKV
jgi:hypothetical protein